VFKFSNVIFPTFYCSLRYQVFWPTAIKDQDSCSDIWSTRSRSTMAAYPTPPSPKTSWRTSTRPRPSMEFSSSRCQNNKTTIKLGGSQTFPVCGPLRIIWWSAKHIILISIGIRGPPVVRGAYFGNHWLALWNSGNKGSFTHSFDTFDLPGPLRVSRIIWTALKMQKS